MISAPFLVVPIHSFSIGYCQTDLTTCSQVAQIWNSVLPQKYNRFSGSPTTIGGSWSPPYHELPVLFSARILPLFCVKTFFSQTFPNVDKMSSAWTMNSAFLAINVLSPTCSALLPNSSFLDVAKRRLCSNWLIHFKFSNSVKIKWHLSLCTIYAPQDSVSCALLAYE